MFTGFWFLAILKMIIKPNAEGHNNLKTTQHFAKIIDRKVSDDMLAFKKIGYWPFNRQ
jgi:hypothetical protein